MYLDTGLVSVSRLELLLWQFCYLSIFIYYKICLLEFVEIKTHIQFISMFCHLLGRVKVHFNLKMGFA